MVGGVQLCDFKHMEAAHRCRSPCVFGPDGSGGAAGTTVLSASPVNSLAFWEEKARIISGNTHMDSPVRPNGWTEGRMDGGDQQGGWGGGTQDGVSRGQQCRED